MQTQLDIKRARAQSANARAKLNRHMGVGGGEGAWTLAGDLPALPSGDPAPTRIVAVALQQRQDLAAAREHAAAMEQALSLKRRTRLVPAVNLGVNTERELDGTQLTGPTLDIEVPLFNWGRASVKKLEAELRQAQAAQEALEAEVRNDVETAHSTLANAREAAAHLRDVLLPQRQRILKETLLHYNAMQKSNFELLLAKKEEQEAEQQFIEALRDYWVARAELEMAAGGSLTPRKSQAAAKSPAPVKKTDSKPQGHAHHH
jgi:cobalt-zinc-cadmium efflux system outer membrane protein